MTRSQRLRVERASTRRRNRFWLGVFGLFATTLVAGLSAWAVLPALLGWFPFAVTSGSMEPIVERGDVIVVQPHDGANLAEGTILVYDTAHGRVAHRITEVLSPVRYVTKGDANRDPDSTPVDADQVVGVARIAVPLIGRLVLFARANPLLHGLPLAIGIVVAAWLSRFALLGRYDPWARIEPEELAPVPTVDPSTIDIDRVMAKRAAERERQRREGPLALPAAESDARRTRDRVGARS
jgi:signal peptidase I